MSQTGDQIVGVHISYPTSHEVMKFEMWLINRI